jgi:hypothetical protein
MAASTVSKKISNLVQIAQELRQGKDFNITRLTSLKSLCADPQAAAQFFLYIAHLMQETLERKSKPHHLEEGFWINGKHVIHEAILAMETYLTNPTKDNEQSLWSSQRKAQEVNHQYEKQAWGPVRIIQSKDVLLIEEAMNGILRPSESSYWGYQVARQYAERYDSRYGAGLIPESAPLVEDIASF